MGAAWYAEDNFEEPIDLLHYQAAAARVSAVTIQNISAFPLMESTVVKVEAMNAPVLLKQSVAIQRAGLGSTFDFSNTQLNANAGYKSLSLPAQLPLYGSNATLSASMVGGFAQDVPPPSIATPTQMPVFNFAVQTRMRQLGLFNIPGMETGVYLNQAYLFLNLGIIYIGEWLRGKPHGRGQMIFSTGGIYDGYFYRGKTIGIGRFVQPNGDYYEGEFFELAAQGRGKCAVGNLYYEGEFMQNVPHGAGYQTTTDGLVSYKGQYNHGQKVYGEMIWTGFHYKGPFVNGLFNGFAIVSTPQGVYQGQFVDGKMVSSIPSSSNIYGSSLSASAVGSYPRGSELAVGSIVLPSNSQYSFGGARATLLPITGRYGGLSY